MITKFPTTHPFAAMGKCLRAVCSILTFALLLSAAAHAQLSGKGAISGTIYDDTGDLTRAE